MRRAILFSIFFICLNLFSQQKSNGFIENKGQIVNENGRANSKVLYLLTFHLGFREQPRIDLYFRMAVQEMIENKEVDLTDRREHAYQKSPVGDFKIVIRDSFLSYDNNMPFWTNFIMKSYYNLKYLTVKEEINFGLDRSNIILEKYPLVVTPGIKKSLIRKKTI